MSSLARWRWHPQLVLLARVYLGLVFVLASQHKILEPASFALDIATYQILPLELVNLMAITLPWIELVAGLMLILGFRTRAGALLVSGMMVLFTLAVSMALFAGLDMSCGCFASQGAAEDPISWRTVARDLAWLALAVYVLCFDRSRLGIDQWLGGASDRKPAAGNRRSS